MFEKQLAATIKVIFDFDKVSYRMPSESQEQEGIFIEIENSRNNINEGLQTAKVTGRIHLFGSEKKLPYGYFSKQIEAADKSLTKDLFFFDFEENKGTVGNICERSCSFIYLFSGQYNPNLGSIESIEFTE